ncbi:uncharacterized protein LOC107273430 isoform X2 [Cephus cinctus]|uniref:Uncharacterized protein LOC107273430 isoform X2 n=1 Tax=Cephus cinctus TaxID=211228 RepID=A0AAJ7CD73_CEPCN|nr:uncharacterized protein LOC107273430 isoform X2 [Cephus cinctus]
MAEGAGDSKTGDNQVSKSQMEVSECLSSWLAYLQALLSTHNSISHCRLTGQCLAGWEELTRVTNVASNTVKNHVMAALRDHNSRESNGDKHDILCDNLLTFINLQYQFCVACCECLGGMAECSCSQTGNTECDIAALQQCFERLYSPPPTSSRQQSQSQRSPLPYPLFPLQVQRRWSETAAAEMCSESSENTMRRWSMPWDCRHVTDWPRQDIRSKLRVPIQDRSRSITPDSVWKSSAMASQDGLQEAIQLLSCKPGIRPSTQLYHPSQHIPGVTLTTCNYEGNYEGSIWPETRRVGSPRCWPHDSHSSDHSDHSGQRDSDHSVHSGEHRDSEQSGASGSGHRDSKDSIHSQSDHSCFRESDAGTNDAMPSRKSSSSTDSGTSAHSRSGSESAGAGECARSQLYSMWSGADLPFIRLPETNEIQDKHHST